jgi:hypothetical protein
VDDNGFDIDRLSPQDRKKYDDRGDIPGYLIPGHSRDGSGSPAGGLSFIYFNTLLS